ncbi:MAG: hypothetical protein KF745_02635 [Phycisphaeraceae bacterium]|nr:hypothetical protein [Phycisphaeraceae bacterium]
MAEVRGWRSKRRFTVAAVAIVSALLTKTPEAEALIAERTKALTAERDAAVAEAAKVRGERAAERIDAALSDAFAKCGAKPEHKADYLTLARGLFTVDESGRVVTRKDAADTLPGVEPAAWIVSQLRAQRPHYWPVSVGGGAAGGRNGIALGDTGCYNPRSPKFNLSDQSRYERRYGKAAADAAIRQYGGRA